VIKGRSAIGIIPARGGSKGLPRKNIRELCGKPLIAWSIEKALKSSCLDTVIVSTDDEEIAEVSRSLGAEVPFIRPSELASDTATTFGVVEHALAFFRIQKLQSFEYTALLEPTSPLREDTDIDNMLERLDGARDYFDAIVSLGETSHHPSLVKRVRDRRVEAFCSELAITNRRQDNEPAYFPFGVAYIIKSDILLKERTFYPARLMGYVVHRYQNYEIDDVYDFLAVEAIMRWQWRLK